MLKEKCAFIGIGQGGGNIVKELEVDDFQCFYINTSLDDLKTIGAGLDKRYAISGTQGMAKDIEFANKIITSDYNDEKIAEAIYTKYANPKIYFFVFTASGGTGGGMGNQIAKKFKELYPEKIVNIVTVLPHAEEDMIMQYNASQCLARIKENLELGYVTNIQILDNNKCEFGKAMDINKTFALYMSDVMNFESDSQDGNLDEEEMERLFSGTAGLLNIHEVENEDFLTNLDELEHNSIYTKHTKDVKTHGLILNYEKNDSTNRSLIREAFGMPVETHFTTWEEKLNIIISVGMELSDNIVDKLKQNYLTLKKLREDIANRGREEKVEVVDVDFSDIIEQKKAPKEVVSESAEPPRRRARRHKGLGIRGESRFIKDRR